MAGLNGHRKRQSKAERKRKQAVMHCSCCATGTGDKRPITGLVSRALLRTHKRRIFGPRRDEVTGNGGDCITRS